MTKSTSEKYKELLDIKRELLLIEKSGKSINSHDSEREEEALRIFDKYYREAKELFAEGTREGIEEAMRVFDILGDHARSRELKEECEKQLALMGDPEDTNRGTAKKSTAGLAEIFGKFRASKKAKLIALFSAIGVALITLLSIFVIYPYVSFNNGYYSPYINFYGVKKFEVPEGVEEIKTSAFVDCEGLERVVIPDGVTKISGSSFIRCGVKELVIPGTVISVGHWAMFDCQSMESVYFKGPPSNWQLFTNSVEGTVYFYSESVPEYPGNYWHYEGEKITVYKDYETEYSAGLSFYSNYDGTCVLSGIGTCTDSEIKVPPMSPACETVVGVISFAFSECLTITGISLPDSTAYIGSNAFANCTALKEISIPQGVTEIGAQAFAGCTKIEKIILPESVTSVGYNAFDGCSALKFVDMGESRIETFDRLVLNSCSSLEYVILPTALKNIQAVFGNYDNHYVIYYCGTEEQWKNVDSLNKFTGSVYFYSETSPITAGNFWRYEDGVPTPWEPIDSGSLEVEISNIQQTIRYVDDDQMIIPVANNELSIDKSYTLELKFTITPSKNSDGYSYFSTVLTFTDISILNGTIKEAETGKLIEQKVIDVATGTDRRSISLSFKIPAEAGVEKQITIVVGLEPLSVASDSEMRLEFSSDDAKISGSDGISRSFSIGAATLKAPTLTVDSANKQITWKHVKNATYYLVFADSQMTGYVIQAGNEAPGADMVLDLINYTDLIGRNVTIQACSDLEYFSPSAQSNAVIVW